MTTSPHASHDLPALRLGRQMKQLHKYVSGHMMKAMQEQLQGDELSFSQVTALHQLRAHTALSIGGLADLTGLSLPAASHLTDRLVQRGLAERRENPDDRRAKMLALTAGGHAFLDDMDRRINETYQQVFARVGQRLIEAAADNLEAVLLELQAQDTATSSLPRCPATSPTLPPEETA
ncbi:MarR family transcriptional regulator [Deinococcus sp. KSM4-11]|uniref:MarR family winged helix-turn-helix transcriptional regulator n=1 Tax=Deinococcus sp. KSM4-11 TaxID=2568654 RepID=UPI0010A4819E|nr:MarR family transcriptional regulator [Deinococcus sp. KSM4-11]THF87248.1 MarR family transcriptional regulator [Deinococcus sp. KSM4-11]